jgi:hypothetical protein
MVHSSWRNRLCRFDFGRIFDFGHDEGALHVADIFQFGQFVDDEVLISAHILGQDLHQIIKSAGNMVAFYYFIQRKDLSFEYLKVFVGMFL